MTQTMILFILLALVFIVLPKIIYNKTGRDVFELLIGRPLFKKDRTEGNGTGSSGAGMASVKNSAADQKRLEKNSTKNDILVTISNVVNYARRNHYKSVIPGALKMGEFSTMFPIILVTRSCVAGINCFGYGGLISTKSRDDTWVQTLNGVSREIPSSVKKSEESLLNLKEIMRGLGIGEVDARVLTVYTSPDVKITGPEKIHIIHSKDLISELGRKDYMQTRGLDPEEIGNKLASVIVRVKEKRKGSLK